MKKKQLKPQLVVLSAPSGAGKTTISKRLAEKNPDFKISVSATTRPPRSTEKQGEDYFFLSEKDFFTHVKNNDFLEYEEVHGHYYGTLKSQVKKYLKGGFTVLFDIDVKGALSIKRHFPPAILFFLRPPSLEELKNRLKSRKTDNEHEITRRLNRLPEEYEKSVFFDYDIVNTDLEKTVNQIAQIVRDHQKRDRYVCE